MNDIIKPFDIDLTKKLHGHVRVETRSRWTGRVVDSQEKDNLITNACQLMLQTYPWYVATSTIYTGMANVWTPIYEKLLGGIMLFDNTLTEQASNIAFPASAKLVGLAGQTANADNVFMGSYNANESVPISNGFTTVWDFLTSQANGTIASLARTSAKVVKAPFGRFSSSQYFNYSIGVSEPPAFTNNYCWLGYDETNKYLYLALRSAKTINGVSYPTSKIYRLKQDLSKITLRNVMPPADQLDVVKTLTSSDGTANAYLFLYDKYDNCFLYATGTTLHIISATDGTHTTKTLTGTSGNGFCVSENYYWRSTGSVVYRISKTNTANVETYTVASSSYLVPTDNDVIFTSGGSQTNLVYPDGTIKQALLVTETNVTANILQVGQFYNYYQGQTYQHYLNATEHYLGTIANLDSPVTKTSSQTMKITYTLTEA